MIVFKLINGDTLHMQFPSGTMMEYSGTPAELARFLDSILIVSMKGILQTETETVEVMADGLRIFFIRENNEALVIDRKDVRRLRNTLNLG